MTVMVKTKKIGLLLIIILSEIVLLYAGDKKYISLNGTWQLYYGPAYSSSPQIPGELMQQNFPYVPATVPGNVELDLFSAGMIKNPEKGNNIYSLRKYEAYQWWYYRTFDTPKLTAGERVEIVFEGLDCFGTIWINNQLVDRTDNMFIEHKFDITRLLADAGENTIYVRIDPAVKEVQKYTHGVIGYRGEARAEGMFARKAPHMYGWDIMPRLISAGLWRGVRLDIKKPTRFEEIYWMTNHVDIVKKEAQLILDWQLSTDYPTVDGLMMEVSLAKSGRAILKNSFSIYSHLGRKKIEIDDVEFWWPRGYGDAALYDATVRIVDDDRNVLDENMKKIGIRTAELIRTDVTSKEKPGEFVFKVNGEKIFAKGTNWVPLDALHSRDKNHLAQAMEMIVDLNCNMIRCWGGNVYEDDEFFDLCDENGIMVWQDFAMACAIYPQSDNFAEKIKKEAISIVLQLRQHPSLVLWCGDNEVDTSIYWFRKGTNSNMNRISREVLPNVVWEYDPLRDYLPSSPFLSEEYFKMGGGYALRPERHLWGPRGYYKAPFYTDVIAHFVSEIGYHGCPNRSSLEKMFDPEYVYPWTKEKVWNDQWLTKAVRPHPEETIYNTRNDLMIKQVIELFGTCPDDLDRFIFASQAVQAEALKYFIEFWRMNKFNKTGILWWNLRDGWPIISDAIVDYYNSKKLAYYFIKRVQKDVCVMIGDPANGNHPVVAVNDTRMEKSGEVCIRNANTGKELFSALFTIPVNNKTIVGYIPCKQEQAMWLIDYSIETEKFTNHYLAGKPPFNLDDYMNWNKQLNIKRE